MLYKQVEVIIRPRCIEVYRSMQRYAEICRGMQRYAEVCRDMQKYTRYDTIYCYIHVTYCNVIEFSLQLMNLSQQVRPGQTYTNQTSPLSLLTTYTLYTTNMYTHLCDEGTAWSTISCGLDSPLIFTSASCDLSEFRLQSSRHLPLL